jgi:uncharacterized membrane protein
MKRFILICLIIASTILAVYSFRTKFQTSIVGRVNPVGGANVVWAVSGRDSTACNVVNGEFNFEARQGIYRVVIDGIEPYKDAVLENISVRDGQTVDVGEIDLQR